MGKETTIAAGVGKTVVLELESNPSAGYEWQPLFDEDRMRLLKHEHVLGGQSLGAPGIERFTFVALKPGATELRLVYKRAWEPTHLEERQFSVRVK